MNSNQITALRREKELLQEILDLAKCQTELMEAGRLDDLEILLSLRAGPLSEMAAMEEATDIEADPAPRASTDELFDLNALNLDILRLVDQIVSLDEDTDRLADYCDRESVTTELSTETGAYFHD